LDPPEPVTGPAGATTPDDAPPAPPAADPADDKPDVELDESGSPAHELNAASAAARATERSAAPRTGRSIDPMKQEAMIDASRGTIAAS
jgi:hypothetical protein